MKHLSQVILGLLFISFTLQARARENSSPLKIRGILNFFFDESPEDKQNDVCSSYEDSEVRVFKAKTFAAPYAIEKIANDTYSAFLNINYVAEKGTNSQVAIEVRERIKKCYAAAGYLTASSGERLLLNLVSENSELARLVRPAIVAVFDPPTPTRIHARRYDRYIDCPAILHETLHLLGLVDEYDESVHQYTCRAKNDSIMSSHFEFHPTPLGVLKVGQLLSGSLFKGMESDVGPKQFEYFAANPDSQFLSVRKIQCEFGDARGIKDCGRMLDKQHGSETFQIHKLCRIDIPGYPDTNKISLNDEVYILNSDLEKTDNKVSLKLNSYFDSLLYLTKGLPWKCFVTGIDSSKVATGRDLAEKVKRKYSHLDLLPLRPAHFRKILNRDCKEKNQVYDLCSSEAYLVPKSGHNCIKDANPVCLTKGWLN